MKTVICTICPRGCHLQVDEANDYAVTGNGCTRGIGYGQSELQHPVRTLTSTVRIEGAAISRLSVKTDRPIGKDLIPDCMECVKQRYQYCSHQNVRAGLNPDIREEHLPEPFAKA